MKDGQIQIFDTYDFLPVGGFDQFLEDIGTGLYPAARTLGGILMPENPDGSSKEEAMRVRITLPSEPNVIDVDFDDEPDEDAGDFVFRGPMTNRRKAIWDTFTSLLATTEMSVPSTITEMRDRYDAVASDPSNDLPTTNELATQGVY